MPSLNHLYVYKRSPHPYSLSPLKGERVGVRGGLFVMTFLIFIAGCSPQRFFYYPNRKLYLDPAQMGLPYLTVQFPSLNGKTLWAILLPTDQTPRGTVVFFHG